MARQKRPPADVAARRERVWEAWCRGQTTRQIAAVEQVDHKQIVRDLAAIDEERAGDQADAARREQAAELARGRYRLVIREALAEWERSKQDRQRERRKAKRSGAGKDATEATEAEQTTEGRLGDAAYLRAVVAAQTRLDAIDGVDAPKKMEHAGPDGGPIPVALSSEERDAIRERIRARLGGPPGAPAGDGPGDAGGSPVAEPDAGDAAGWLDA